MRRVGAESPAASVARAEKVSLVRQSSHSFFIAVVICREWCGSAILVRLYSWSSTYVFITSPPVNLHIILPLAPTRHFPSVIPNSSFPTHHPLSIILHPSSPTHHPNYPPPIIPHYEAVQAFGSTIAWRANLAVYRYDILWKNSGSYHYPLGT